VSVVVRGVCREWPWEKERKPVSTKPPKGHRRDAEGAKVRERIADKMAKMDQIIADFRAAQKPKPKSASEHTLDTFLLDKKSVRGLTAAFSPPPSLSLPCLERRPLAREPVSLLNTRRWFQIGPM
jgi:hypothetical protein